MVCMDRIDSPSNTYRAKNEQVAGQLLSLRENGHFPSVHCFPECQKSGTRGRASSPSVALGEEKHSGKRGFPECHRVHGTRGRETLGEGPLPRVQHSGKRGTRGRKLVLNGGSGRSYVKKFFPECHPLALGG
jgi:hypothetical protein